MMNGKLLGVIGGMGPYASAYFYRRITALQNVAREQDYMDVLIYSKPSIPDRSAFILGRDWTSPFDAILAAGRVLENAGVDLIAVPCVTSHYFYDALIKELRVPVINMAKETARKAAETGAEKIGLLATDGTIQGRVLHNELQKLGAEAVTLPEKSQQCLMDLIYQSGKLGGVMATDALDSFTRELYRLGAETVIIGCTEISMAGREWHKGKHIDALEVLAEVALVNMGIL